VNISSSEDEEPTLCDYAFKLLNPAQKKTDYRIYNIRSHAPFEDIESLEQFIISSFKAFHGYHGTMSIGYVVPGHGWKGEQNWLNDDKDLSEMY
jgi:hypothetical protein